MKANNGYPKPCETCYWKKWPYARKDEVCGFHDQPNADGTCRYFEHEFTDVEYDYLRKRDGVRGLR